MKTGTAIWLIGWMFVLGMVFHDEVKKNPKYRLSWKEAVCTLIAWPVVIGYEYKEARISV